MRGIEFDVEMANKEFKVLSKKTLSLPSAKRSALGEMECPLFRRPTATPKAAIVILNTNATVTTERAPPSEKFGIITSFDLYPIHQLGMDAEIW